jgi:two-component system response regulator MprA
MKHLLVIDDEPFVRDALKRVLEASEVRVDVAEDAESGLLQIARQAYDLVILDIIMPGMDGVQLIRRLRADYPAIAIIAISGGGNFELSGYRPEAVSTQAYLAAASSAGADGVLAKPFETDELEALVRPMLKTGAVRKKLS